LRRRCQMMMARLSAIVADLHRIARHIHAHVVVAPGEEEEDHAVAFAAEAVGRIGGDDELAGARVVNAGGEFREAANATDTTLTTAIANLIRLSK